jgi:hypothetical protein
MSTDFQNAETFCKNHPDKSASGYCEICYELYCDDCLHVFDEHAICFDHMDIFLESNWEALEVIETKPQDASLTKEDQAKKNSISLDKSDPVALQEMRKHLFSKHLIPTLATYDYFESNGVISTLVTLYASSESKELAHQFLNQPSLLLPQ